MHKYVKLTHVKQYINLIKIFIKRFEIDRGVTLVGREALEDFLLNPNNYYTLDLEGINLVEQETIRIFEVLKDNETLTRLNLSCNTINQQVADSISEALKSNNSLEYLNLDDTDLNNESLIIISEALKINTALTKLIICGDEISNNGVESLSAALMVNTTLKKLTIASENIDDTGLEHLCEVLKHNSSLTSLGVEFCAISAVGVTQLAASLLDNTSITSLSFKGIILTAEMLEPIAELLKTSTFITSINLNHTELYEEVVVMLHEVLKSNFFITKVVLEDDISSNNSVNDMRLEMEAFIDSNKLIYANTMETLIEIVQGVHIENTAHIGHLKHYQNFSDTFKLALKSEGFNDIALNVIDNYISKNYFAITSVCQNFVINSDLMPIDMIVCISTLLTLDDINPNQVADIELNGGEACIEL